MRSTRVAWFLLLAGFVFLTGHLLFNGAPAFQGELRVGKTESASIAVHPTDYSSASHPAPADTDSRRYAVQLSDIPFAEPALAEQWIDPRLRYDIATLPFHLRLTQTAILSPANIAPYLEVRPPGAKAKTTKIALTPGQAAHVGAEDLRVDCIRPWAGLLRLPAGRPAASVAVRTPENTWLENLIIEKDSWLYAGTDLAIRLVWHDSDQAARAAAESGAPPSEPPRWGVMDGGAINWLDSMTPGTGLQLNSGAKVTLAQVDPSHVTEKGKQFAILLQIDQAGERKQEWVIANNPDENASYRLEYSAARDMLLVLHTARDGFCVVSAYYHYRFAGSDALGEGETWSPKDVPYSIRLDQLLSAGIPVTAQQSSLDEVVLVGPSRTIRIREGETQTFEDDRVRFVQDVTPPRVRYELSVTPRVATNGEYTVTLEPGEHVTVGGVTLSQGPVNAKNPDLATLTVTIRRSYTLAVIGAVFLVSGLFALLRRPHSSPPK